MHLSLIFFIVCVFWPCLGDGFEQTDQTTKSDADISQVNSTLDTVRDNSMDKSSAEQMTTPEHSATHGSSTISLPSQTSSSNAWNRAGEHQAATTTKSSEDGSGISTRSQTTGQGISTRSQTTGQGISTRSQTTGQGISTRSQTTGQGISTRSQTTGQGISTRSQTTGQGISTRSQTTGQGISTRSQTTGQESSADARTETDHETVTTLEPSLLLGSPHTSHQLHTTPNTMEQTGSSENDESTGVTTDNYVERGITTAMTTGKPDYTDDSKANLEVTSSESPTQVNHRTTTNDFRPTSQNLISLSTNAQFRNGVWDSNATTAGDEIYPTTKSDHEYGADYNDSTSMASSLLSSKSVSSSKLPSHGTSTISQRTISTTVASRTESDSDDSSVSVSGNENKTQGVTDNVKGTTMNASVSRNISTTTLITLLSSSPYTPYPPTNTVPGFTHSATVVDITTSAPNITFETFVALTTENFTACFQEDKTQQFYALAGQVSFSNNSYNNTTREICSMEFTVPSEMVMQMAVSIDKESCLAYYLYIRTYEPVYFSRYLACYSQSARFLSPGNSVSFRLVRYSVNASLELSFNFTAVPPPELQVTFTTNTTGYVQTPDWDGVTKYPSHLDTWARLDVPSNFSVMVSFSAVDIEGHPDCGYDRLTVFVGENKTANESLELIHCNDQPVLKPTVFHTTVLRFHFESDGFVEHLGFRLYFSFHHESEVPEKLDDGKWNCSVPYWPNFQTHFNCNRVEECSNGEDEEFCSHSSDSCEKGFFAIGSNCYIFISGDDYVTWNEAANDCLRREAHLASLNSAMEWVKVMQVLRQLMKEAVYFGLQTSGPTFPELYRNRFQWADDSAVFYAHVRPAYYSSSADCSALKQSNWYVDTLMMVDCNDNMTTSFLCEKDAMPETDSEENSLEIELNPPEWEANVDKYVACPAGHFTQTFFACDLQTSCWGSQSELSGLACDYQATPLPPSLQCRNGVDHVPYSLVCDHRPDCSDNSDEDFCIFPSCRLSGKFQCTNKQCVTHEQRCDRILHCLDGSDERQCPMQYQGGLFTPPPPAIIHFDGYGSYEVEPLVLPANQTNTSRTHICPETHFLCPGNLTYCMPVFVRCNGVYDCPGREDEDGCDRHLCPGFYRCRSSPVCVHSSHLCDGVFQCPQQDDELLCDLTCPQNCSCQGLAFYCRGHFPAEQYQELRFLHAVESGLSPQKLKVNTMLIYLNLAKCRLKEFNRVEFPNIRILDLSDNELVTIETNQMKSMNNLQKLSLAGNPLVSIFNSEHESYLQFPLLHTLDLSNVILSEMNVTTLTIFPKLAFLNLTGSGINRIAGEGFHLLTHLRYLDMRQCLLTEFPQNIFKGLRALKEVWADNYKLCCPATLPKHFHLANCHSPSDEISSCDALLRSDFYRIVLSVFAALALIGNLGSFVYRVFINRVASNLGFGAFVTHLCISDFLMGVYLAVIGIADRMYQGNYLWNDDLWKHSIGCKVAGFLSLLSSEVSAFIICLITFDRFLVLRFPFSSVHFKKKSAHGACMVVWLIGIVLAGIPLLPVTAHWHFYSQNGICIPLPITRNDFAGHDYSFTVMIIVNFILFLLIAAGQVFIYWSIRSNTIAAADTNKKSNDLTIARRLITIAMSDFLCWFPIGLLGLLAATGVPVPGEVNVAVAIIILPVNSAINPFLYTLNMLMERRRRAQEQKIQKMMMSTFASKYSETVVDRLDDSYTKTEALSLIRSWLSQNLLSLENLEKVTLEAEEKQNATENQAK